MTQRWPWGSQIKKNCPKLYENLYKIYISRIFHDNFSPLKNSINKNQSHQSMERDYFFITLFTYTYKSLQLHLVLSNLQVFSVFRYLKNDFVILSQEIVSLVFHEIKLFAMKLNSSDFLRKRSLKLFCISKIHPKSLTLPSFNLGKKASCATSQYHIFLTFSQKFGTNMA